MSPCTDCQGGAPCPPPVPTRRGFLYRIGVGLGAIAAVLAGVPIIGFLFAPFVRVAKNKWVAIGSLSAFPSGQTRMASYENPVTVPWDGDAAKIPCWVRRVDDGDKPTSFQVFAINCTHLGCPVKWFQESGLFMCPCHGGVYYEDGSHASGPPPRGLYEYELRIVDGRLEIDAGRMPTLGEST